MGFLLLVIPAICAAETNQEWLAQAWQTEEGLPENVVSGVVQTPDGCLWVGTPSGLTRFDGLQFEAVSLTNVIAAPNRGIIAMLRGNDNALWLAMDRGGVVRLSGNSSRAFVQDLPVSIPNGMAQDAEGGLWIAYRGGAVYYAKNDRVIPVTAAQGLPAGADICALARDRVGRIWFAKAGQVGRSSNGQLHVVCRMDSQPMRLAAASDGAIWVCCGFHVYKCDDRGRVQDFGGFHPENSGSVATVMLEDRDGNLWIGTSFSGLYRYGPAGFQTIIRGGILSLTEDREGNIWAGTSGGGLNRIRRRAIGLEDTDTGLPFPSVQSICEAADGTIWAATQNGALAHKVGDRWYTIPVTAEWPGEATCVAADARGAVWIGARHGLYCWRDGKFADWGDTTLTRDETFHTLLASRAGDLWAGEESPNALLRLHAGKITQFSIASTTRVIRAMAEDAAGNIWAGTSRGNLLCAHGGQVTDVTPRPAEDLASIRCLYATPDGALWIGYAGWGVGCLKNGHYAEINSAQGLFDDYISHIVADGQGWLWFGGNRGIFKTRQQDFDDVIAGRALRVRSVHYGRGAGLPSLQGTFGDSPDVLRSRDGRVWIPMQTALVVAVPSTPQEKSEPLQTLLTRVLVDERVVAEYRSLTPDNVTHQDPPLELAANEVTLHLPPEHRRIRFEFTVFSFNAPENIQFRHRLTGIEDDWVDAGSLRSVTYPHLASGSYDFQITARDSEGDWSPVVAHVRLAVAPFFWQTWWFRLLVVAVFTLCVIAVVRYVSFQRLRARLRHLEQQAAVQRERSRIAKDIHDDLGANLTQIAYLGELANQDRGEPNLVGERIGKISATARQAVKSLDEIVWAVNPRNDTLAHLLDYAGQFAVDYLRTMGIRCRLDFPTEVPPRELSTDLRHNLFLVIKEALHNIFKHARATEVRLRAVVDARALEVGIEDNGCGFAQAPEDAQADGLRNMQQRMAEIGGEFRAESKPGKGTKIVLRLSWPAAD